jgi:hypothetical protein
LATARRFDETVMARSVKFYDRKKRGALFCHARAGKNFDDFTKGTGKLMRCT